MRVFVKGAFQAVYLHPSTLAQYPDRTLHPPPFSTQTTLLTDKAVGQADRPLSLRVETDGSLVSDAGVRAHVLTPDDGRCGGGAPALYVVDTVLLPFKLDK